MLLQRLEAVDDTQQKREYPRGREARELFEALPGDVLHHQESAARGREAEVEHRRQDRVLDRLQAAAELQESLALLLGLGGVAVEQLDRDGLAGLRVDAAKDAARLAGA